MNQHDEVQLVIWVIPLVAPLVKMLWTRMVHPAQIDHPKSKAYLTNMNAVTKLSSKGQIVIPKDVRDALGWPKGQALVVRQSGGRAILEPAELQRETITYEEFRRRVPKYDGPRVSIEDMRVKDDDGYRDMAD